MNVVLIATYLGRLVMTDRPLPKISSPQIKSVGGGGTRPLTDPSMSMAWAPPPINTLADTGLNLLSVADLVLKVLYFGGYMAGHQVAEIVKLPFTGVVDQVMDFLKREKFVEVRGSGGLGEAGYQYLISQKGSEKAREALERSQYAGAAPVTLQQYIYSMHMQNREKLIVHEDDMKTLMKNLVVSEEQLARIGPAVNSGRSVFMYGAPGN